MDKPYSVIIDGDCLTYALATSEQFPTRELFRELGMASKAVVCCRVSPDQKASVVAIVNDKYGIKPDTPNVHIISILFFTLTHTCTHE